MNVLNTIQEYLKWRGDISFLQEGLNEVDSLLFCAFTYFDLEKIITHEEKISILNLYERFLKFKNKDKKEEVELFKNLSQSKRFQDVFVTLYFNEIDKEKEMQISGMTFVLPNNTIFVAFKGTDSTLTGWKEDFNISYLDTIPSQIKAKEYLDKILMHTNKKVYIGGHSKGGNLAMYASIYCKDFTKVVKVYNFDGPGFDNKIVLSENYQSRKEKMVTYLPKAGIVGNILNKDMKTIIIKSTQLGLLQHDPYSWKVEQNHFIYAQVLNEEAKKISNILDDLIEKIPNNQKEKIITFVYDVLDSVHLSELNKSLKGLLSKYKFNLDEFTIIKKILPILLKICQ